MQVTEWNRNMELHYSISHAEAIDKPIYELIEEFSGSEGQQMLQQVLQGKNLFITEKKYARRAGYYQAQLTPLHNTKKEVIEALLVIHDISEQKEALERINDQNIKLKG